MCLQLLNEELIRDNTITWRTGLLLRKGYPDSLPVVHSSSTRTLSAADQARSIRNSICYSWGWGGAGAKRVVLEARWVPRDAVRDTHSSAGKQTQKRIERQGAAQARRGHSISAAFAQESPAEVPAAQQL